MCFFLSGWLEQFGLPLINQTNETADLFSYAHTGEYRGERELIKKKL